MIPAISGKLAQEARAYDAECRLHALRSCSWLDPHECKHALHLGICQEVPCRTSFNREHAEWQVGLRLDDGSRSQKSFGRNANYRYGMPVDRNCSPDNRRVVPEAGSPVVITEYDDWIGSRSRSLHRQNEPA